MNSEEGFLARFSDLTGITQPALKLLLTVLAGMNIFSPFFKIII